MFYLILVVHIYRIKCHAKGVGKYSGDATEISNKNDILSAAELIWGIVECKTFGRYIYIECGGAM